MEAAELSPSYLDPFAQAGLPGQPCRSSEQASAGCGRRQFAAVGQAQRQRGVCTPTALVLVDLTPDRLPNGDLARGHQSYQRTTQVGDTPRGSTRSGQPPEDGVKVAGLVDECRAERTSSPSTRRSVRRQSSSSLSAAWGPPPLISAGCPSLTSSTRLRSSVGLLGALAGSAIAASVYFSSKSARGSSDTTGVRVGETARPSRS